MEISTEQITIVLTIALFGAKAFEWIARGIYFLILKATGKKDSLMQLSDLLGKATNNHLHTIQEAEQTLVDLTVKGNMQHEMMIKQGDRMLDTHEAQIRILGEISGKLSK